MPIERKQVARHILITDTNVLWCEDKALCVSSEFTKFLEANAGKYEIDLALPEVVIGELKFQQTTSALKALQKANLEFQRMSQIADRKYSHRVGETRVRRDVERKLSAWIQQTHCNVINTPVGSIDWNKLIDDAIWRRPPFVEDKNTEKGFRDAVIVQTVADIIEKNPGIDIAFISADGLARAAAESVVGDNCTCYETLEEFESFLRLTDEQLTNEFVRGIQTRARIKFHLEKDSSSLIYRDNLIERIRDQFQDQLATPAPPVTSGLLGGVGGLRTAKNCWVPVTRESIWIRAPQFVSLENENEFRWRSRINFVQFFSYEGAASGSLLTGQVKEGDQKLRKVSFPVIWTSKVTKNGRFLSMQFEKFEKAETGFEPTTESERVLYGITEQEPTSSP